MLKRGFDLFFSILGLLILAPLIACVAVVIAAFMGLPVLFRQQRPGLGGEPFMLYKFGTMRDGEADDAERLTGLGRAMRRLSLDELPQLWNVLRGDMSFVGPRPLLMEYLPLYSAEQARRHEVRPGITGWAQVNGRNALTWEQKFGLDVWYVDHRSLRLDLEILAQTASEVIRGTGVSAADHATMEPYRGTRE